NRVLEEFGPRVRVRVLHDRAFHDALQTPHKSFEPFCPYDRYQEVLRGCDVALLPLEPTRFNRMKSDLKFVECAAQGVAVLASPTVYEGSVKDGETGWLYHTPEEFERRLRQLLGDAPLRLRIADAAYAWVRDHRLLSQHIRGRIDAYFRMRDQLPRLTA